MSNYVVIRATFEDGETTATYEELVPDQHYTVLQQALKDPDSVDRNFFEMAEFSMASLVFPPAAQIAAAVSYMNIEAAILPGAAVPDWQPVVDTAYGNVRITAPLSYADKTLVLTADLAPLPPCRLAFYNVSNVLIAPGSGVDSVWYIVLKR